MCGSYPIRSRPDNPTYRPLQTGGHTGHDAVAFWLVTTEPASRAANTIRVFTIFFFMVVILYPGAARFHEFNAA